MLLLEFCLTPERYSQDCYRHSIGWSYLYPMCVSLERFNYQAYGDWGRFQLLWTIFGVVHGIARGGPEILVIQKPTVYVGNILILYIHKQFGH